MRYLPFKIWFLVTVMLALGAVVVRLVWEVTLNPSAGTLTVIILLILAILSFYALLTYLTIKPNLKKLKSWPAAILAMVIATAGVISGTIHFIHFVPSPEATESLSLIIAALLLLALVSAYFLLLGVIWSFWKGGKN